MIFWRTKCDILFATNSDLLYIIYMLGKRGDIDLTLGLIAVLTPNFHKVAILAP